MEPVSYAAAEEDCTIGLIMNIFDDSDKVGADQGMDRPGVRQVPGGSGEEGKMEKTGCEVICGAPTTVAVKG